jgi:hypothetical protein
MTSSATVPCWDNIFSVWAVALAAGFVLAAAMILWWAYFSRTASSRSYLAMCLVFAVAMAGLVVRKEHQQSIRTEDLAALKAFDAEADQLFQESLNLNNDTDYPVYQAKADDFSRKLDTWVADKLGPRASDVLHRHDPKNANIAFESALDKNHESSLATIHQTRENLTALIDAGASDKCVASTRPEHPVPQPEVRK